MSKQRTNELIQGAHFQWILRRRKGVYVADGRSGNTPPVGRHSLGTRDAKEARNVIGELDLKMAVQHGRLPASALAGVVTNGLLLGAGLDYFMNSKSGLRQRSIARYASGLALFSAFCEVERLQFWQQVNNGVLQRFQLDLRKRKYATASCWYNAALVKTVHRFLCLTEQLTDAKPLTLLLPKGASKSRYAYTSAEVAAMVDYCRSDCTLRWLAPVLSTLAYTGARVGELIQLRWSCVDPVGRTITFRDNSDLVGVAGLEITTTKSHRTRVITIHPELLEILNELPRAEDGLVFHGPSGGKLHDSTVLRIFKDRVLSVLKSRFPRSEGALGLEDGVLHSFRHFFVAWCVDNGTPRDVCQTWVGHSDSAMLRHYYDLKSDRSAAFMQQLPAIGLLSRGSASPG